MNRVLYAKLLYAIYSPFQNIKLKWNGIKTSGIVYTAGSLFVCRAKNSTLTIGHGCRFMSKECGNLIGLYHKCILSTEKNAILRIGNNCSFSGVSIRCFKEIVLADNVRVGANCLILDGDEHQDDPRAGRNRPVYIDENVWLGANVVVKKGVHIGRNSVIGLNSVVTKDIPANCVAIGNPCVVVKQFSEEKVKEIEERRK